MVNSKYTGLVVALFILALAFFLSNHWKLPSLLTMAGSTKEQAVAKTSNNSQKSVPDEFIIDDSSTLTAQDFSTLSTQALWQNLLTDFRTAKTGSTDLEDALVLRLRKEPGNAIYIELLSLFRQKTLQARPQQILLSLLGEVGNYQAAETLMRLVQEGLVSDDSDVKLSAFRAIVKFSPESWHDHPNTELAPVFETAWQQTQNAEFLAPIANVMASIGTPATLDIFLKTLTDNNNEDRVEAVKQAMSTLANPTLVPKLAESLQASTVEDVKLASGYALANMGDINAASALLPWASQVDINQVDLVKIWFETAMNTTPEFIDYLESHLAKQSFTAPEVKQAIEEELANAKDGVE